MRETTIAVATQFAAATCQRVLSSFGNGEEPTVGGEDSGFFSERAPNRIENLLDPCPLGPECLRQLGRHGNPVTITLSCADFLLHLFQHAASEATSSQWRTRALAASVPSGVRRTTLV
jgi:hypothetical protein